MALSAEQILAADDLPRVRVDVPEWAPAGTDPKEACVYVRRMNGEELDQYEEAIRRHSDEQFNLVSRDGLRAVVVALTTCDDSGQRLFSLEQVKSLEAKSGEVLQRIFSPAAELNGLTKGAQEKLEKN